MENYSVGNLKSFTLIVLFVDETLVISSHDVLNKRVVGGGCGMMFFVLYF